MHDSTSFNANDFQENEQRNVVPTSGRIIGKRAMCVGDRTRMGSIPTYVVGGPTRIDRENTMTEAHAKEEALQ